MSLEMSPENSRDVRRREDPPLVSGEARFTDDLSPAEFEMDTLLHAAILRSQYANANIVDVDTEAAEALDGVVAVFTGEDVATSDASGQIAVAGNFPGQRTPPFSMLASDRARFTGEAIAVVLAEDRYTAHDGADKIDVKYERRDAVTTVTEALADDAPHIHESLGTNRLFDWEFGDEKATQQAFREADRTVELTIENQRLAPVALEPRGALCDYDPDRETIQVHLSTQAPHGTRDVIAEMLDLSTVDIRVVTPDVGGGFGSKGPAPKAGEPLTAWCSQMVGKPVKWTATRTENLRAGPHGRGSQIDGALAFDDDGTINGLRVRIRANIGAYLTWWQVGVAHIKRLISGPYDIPAIDGEAVGAVTNTAPIAPYRGAGRPEANYVVERLIDRAAAAIGMDPAKVRRQNFFQPEQFPIETAVGTRYDSGEYERAMDIALASAEYETTRERQQELREEGRYLGIGIGSFVENTGTPGWAEASRVTLEEDGCVTAYSETTAHGQGHATVFSKLVAETLGVDVEAVAYNDGDTNDLENGVGTFASRSAPHAGDALIEGARQIREAAREVAAAELEADITDIEFANGTFHVTGTTDRSIDIQEIASLVHSAVPTPVESDGLSVRTTGDIDDFAFTFGTHIAVVEIDPETGAVDFERYVAVDDCGRQFNPMIVEGQIHGGIAQGIEEALHGEAVYDDNGSLVTGSLQDYTLVRGLDIPELETDSTVTPSPVTQTGAKGTGESGTIAAPPAIVNAVVDALAPLGVTHLQKPLTQESIWQAIRKATEGK